MSRIYLFLEMKLSQNKFFDHLPEISNKTGIIEIKYQVCVYILSISK